jgi:hypothetical protein
MHPSEDELILHYYGEDGAAEASVETHLASCDACGASWQQLRRVMETIDAAPVPEPGPAFERTLWAALAPQLEKKEGQTLFSVFRKMGSVPLFAFAGSLAAIVLVVGALWMTPAAPPAADTTQADAAGALREQVMLTAVSDHIEQSEVVLVELANTAPGQGRVDVSLERTAADDLVSAGRLYRETARETGNLQLAELLEELELVLVDIARGPDALSADQLTAIRDQIEQQQLLFKLRVLAAEVKLRQQSAAQATSQRTL